MEDTFLAEALAAERRAAFSALHAAMPGSIAAYDPEAGTAEVQPGLRRRTAEGWILTAPRLMGVPVLRPAADYVPAVGDPCLLIFCDFCLDGWLESGQPVVPPSPRMHDLSDAIALVGCFGKGKEMEDS